MILRSEVINAGVIPLNLGVRFYRLSTKFNLNQLFANAMISPET